MNKKILAVDLDGTLFDDNKDICKKNIDALNAMLDAGHVLAVDTGRPTHVMKNLLKP
ncbi:MAG: HAD hydrolase family protein, partial [Pseudobutyrivibrio sp.]|nr:HAD hydrolase family protein [Pseudobutyrivibrio sp.]